MKKTQKGFTLVELLVVIAILAILSTVAVVGYTSFIDKAEKQAAETEAAQIADYIEATFISDEYVKLADGMFLVKVVADGNVTYKFAGDDEGKTAPAATGTYIDALKELKGTLAYGTVGEGSEAKSGLVYTSEKKVEVLVWECEEGTTPTP